MVITKEGDAYIARYEEKETKGMSFADAIVNMLALLELEVLPEEEFQSFFSTVPSRVQLLVKGHMVRWQDALPQYYR